MPSHYLAVGRVGEMDAPSATLGRRLLTTSNQSITAHVRSSAPLRFRGQLTLWVNPTLTSINFYVQ